MMPAVITGVSYVLCHVPDLVRYGSKPMREVRANPELLSRINGSLRSYEAAVAYPPHQVFVGGESPESLYELPQPWWGETALANGADGAGRDRRSGRYGEIMPQAEFYGLLKMFDDFDLVSLQQDFAGDVESQLRAHSLVGENDLNRLDGVPTSDLEAAVASEGALPLFDGRSNGDAVGLIRRGHEEDDNHTPGVLLENLTCKASAVLALRHLYEKTAARGIGPMDVEYVMNTGEEGVGDRYQRGAGNLAKAVAECTGMGAATGADVKAFCCAPVHGLVMAAALVEAGIFENVVVLGGGSQAKLGMKFQGHLAHETPILEDVLAAFAIMVSSSRRASGPIVRLDAVGRHTVGAGSSQQAIFERLVLDPLRRLGWKTTDIDRYSTELHNPEITLPSGSGDVPRNNYRVIGALARRNGDIPREELNGFQRAYGLPGYAPTQGHVASAVPYLGEACRQIENGRLRRTLFLAKGSLFLGKMTRASDGVSVVVSTDEH